MRETPFDADGIDRKKHRNPLVIVLGKDPVVEIHEVITSIGRRARRWEIGPALGGSGHGSSPLEAPQIE